MSNLADVLLGTAATHVGRLRYADLDDLTARVEGVELTLVDAGGADSAPGEVGEIAVRGHNVMKGYRGRPDATAQAVRGDRKKDMIIRGGYNVYPRETDVLAAVAR